MTIAEGDGVLVGETGVGADEFESAFGELLGAVIGETFDERIFTGHDLVEIERDFLGMDAPDLGVLGDLFDFGGVEEGLGGHATAKDAEAADLLSAFDDDGAKAGVGGGAGGGVTSAAAADDGDVEVKFVHGQKM